MLSPAKLPTFMGAGSAGVFSLTAPARFPWRGALLRRTDIARCQGRCWLRRLGSRRTDPNLNEIVVTITAIDDHDSIAIDSALSGQIIHGPLTETFRLARPTRAARIDNDVRGGSG